MRKVKVSEIARVISRLCVEANTVLRPDVLLGLRKALKIERGRARRIIQAIIENSAVAKAQGLAICQDTGMVEVFLEVGQALSFVGGDLVKAINAGVRDGYKRCFLRKSVVADPLLRKNTRDNTPAVIYIETVPGRKIRITVFPKGFGSENKSQIKMFPPTAGPGQLKKFVVEVARNAGADACPPLVVGVGIGGTMDKAAVLSKEALLRPIHKRNPHRCLGRLEKEILSDINRLGIGPSGLGGKTTALGVNVEAYPTHIAGMPVAVSISCHATRSAAAVL